MAATNTRDMCCFKGRGKISLATYEQYRAGLAGLMFVGNASTFSINVTEAKTEVQDYTSAAGGLSCAIRSIEKAEAHLTLRCHKRENLALALYGESAALEAIAAVAEPHVAWPGAIVPLDGIADTGAQFLVKSADGETTYAPGKDYEIGVAGALEIIAGSTIPEPVVNMGVAQPNIAVTYQQAAGSRVQLFTRPSREMVLHFEGENMAGGVASFDLFCVQFAPATAFNIIADDVSQLELNGAVLRDRSRPAGTPDAPFSQYGTLAFAF